ncbi:MAG: CoA-binding protein [Chitinophagaceae bacterium]|nr:CoA-binding protein [Chitinophagaceae bacterium]
MNTQKKTLVIGASENKERYSNLAVNLLRQYNHPVVAIGNKVGKINDVEIVVGKPILKDIDTITLYLSEKYQQEYYDYLVSLKPKRIIFNPGTENDELVELAKSNHIEPLEACTLVLLKTGQY